MDGNGPAEQQTGDEENGGQLENHQAGQAEQAEQKVLGKAAQPGCVAADGACDKSGGRVEMACQDRSSLAELPPDPRVGDRMQGHGDRTEPNRPDRELPPETVVIRRCVSRGHREGPEEVAVGTLWGSPVWMTSAGKGWGTGTALRTRCNATVPRKTLPDGANFGDPELDNKFLWT